MIVLNENIIYIYLNQKKFKLNINNIKKLKIFWFEKYLLIFFFNYY